MKRSLNWKDVTYGDFQTITIEIAENKLPGLVFDEYGLPGGPQMGIDIIQRNKSDGGMVMIQCKREEKLTKGEIKKIVEVFFKGELWKTCSEFYLATTALLRSKELLAALKEHEKLFKAKNIEFHWWDKQMIEQKLMEMYPVVAKYFSPEDADAFCNEEVIQFPENWEAPECAISRTLNPAAIYKSKEDAFWFSPSLESISLIDLCMKSRLSPLRICLLAAPYQGKSVCVRRFARELVSMGQHFQPIILDIKGKNVEPLADMLDHGFRGWKSIPYKNLVLIIDGMDEAPTTEFVKLSRYIAEFATAYQAIKMVVACRTMFYSNYLLNDELPKFQLLQLAPLDWEEIKKYVACRLGEQADIFEEEVHRKDLVHWLFHPFYLVVLVDRFLTDGGLPDSKIQVIDEFVEKAFRRAEHRLLADGSKLAMELPRFTAAMEQLALIMQLNGSNAFSSTDIGLTFPAKEVELLKHSGLIDIQGTNLVFTNAFFQEHLAARFLTRMSLDIILQWCSVGSTIRKVKIKWLQTINLLISLLDRQSNLYKGLLNFLEEDSVELIFQTDPSLQDEAFKLGRLDMLIRFMIDNVLWPRLVQTKAIGYFMNEVSQAPTYLLDLISDSSMPGHVRIFACRVLEAIPSVAAMGQEMLDLVFRRIEATNSIEERAELIAILVVHKLGDISDVNRLLSVGYLHEDHQFRYRVYDWIIALQLTHQFWSYGLEGVPILVEYNRLKSIGGSDASLAEFLLTVQDRVEMAQLFSALSKGAWHYVSGFKDENEAGFQNKLLDRCVWICESDPLAIISMAEYFRTADRYLLRKNKKFASAFAKDTKGRSLLVRQLIDDLLGEKSHELAWLVTSDDVDYIMFELEEQGYNHGKLNGLASGLSELDVDIRAFRDRVHDASGGCVFSKADFKELERMKKMEEKRRRNDITCIQSLDAFKKAIKRLFTVYKTKLISIGDLYDDRTGKNREVASEFIISFIRQVMGGGSCVSLEECLEALTERAFSYFRAEELLDYSYRAPETDVLFSTILKDFFKAEYPKHKFANAYSEVDGYNITDNQAVILGRIFVKFDFDMKPNAVAEMIWLDNGEWGRSRFLSNENSSIGERVVSLLKGHKAILKKKIVDNLKLGIQSQTILKSHIALCGKLEIKEARPILLDIMGKRKVDEYSLETVAGVFLGLGGNKADLVPLLESAVPPENFWMYLMKELKDVSRDKVIQMGVQMLKNDPIADNRTIPIAQLLASMGIMEGFVFQVRALSEAQRATMLLQHSRYRLKVNTREALEAIKDVIYMVVDSQYAGMQPPENPEPLISAWLMELSEQSENDMLDVITFLEESERYWIAKFSGAKIMRWYIYRIKEKFRNSAQDKTMDIKQIKHLLEDAGQQLLLPAS
jgi:hypothetical protein